LKANAKKVLIVGNGKSFCDPNAKDLNENNNIFRINNFFRE
jgi:phosphoheptose isomerase